MYPDGTVARTYSATAPGRADGSLVLAGDVTITKLRQNFTSNDSPVFQLKGPDQTTLTLNGGRIDHDGSNGRLTGETSGRLPFELEGQPNRTDSSGQQTPLYEAYEAKGGATRYLYRDGVTMTVTRDGRAMEIKYQNGTEIRIDQNGRFEVKQSGGTTHVTEFNQLIQYKNSSGRITNY